MKDLIKKIVDALIRNKPKTATRHVDEVLRQKVKKSLTKKKQEVAKNLLRKKK